MSEPGAFYTMRSTLLIVFTITCLGILSGCPAKVRTTQVFFDEMPTPSKQAFERHLTDYQVDDVVFMEPEHGSGLYQIKAHHDEQRVTVFIDPHGTRIDIRRDY